MRRAGGAERRRGAAGEADEGGERRRGRRGEELIPSTGTQSREAKPEFLSSPRLTHGNGAIQFTNWHVMLKLNASPYTYALETSGSLFRTRGPLII